MRDADQQPAASPVGQGAAYTAVHGEAERPSILSFVADVANIVTLAGLSCGVLGIYFALVQNFPAAVIAMLWAVLFDWYDGPVARRTPERSLTRKLVGIKMDSLVDVISSAVCPAIMLLSYGEFSGWFYPGALAIVMAGVLRLAYFDVFGVHEDGTIAGLSIDITPLVLSLVFVLEGFGLVTHNLFATLFYAIIVVLAFLHVAPFRMRKMVGPWYPIITAHVLVMTAVYGVILLIG
jgi:CDP-diacylglycerol--serine O-phosphatidyltransferase